MSERGRGKGSRKAWAAVLVPPLLLALYVLSIGPVVYATLRNRDSGQHAVSALSRFYAPVDWLMEATPLKWPLKGYVNWWYAAAGEGPRQ